jgi:hypothetical protein
MEARAPVSAEGTVTLIYTTPSGLKYNLAVASDTGEAFLETDWFDFADKEAQPDPGPRKKRLRRIRLEIETGEFQITISAKNNLQDATQFVQTYTAVGNLARTFNPMPPMYRWWKLRIFDPPPQSRWSWTRIQLWGDLGGELREEQAGLEGVGESTVVTGEVTLVPGQVITTILHSKIKLSSKILMEPKTAHAAAALLAVYVGSIVDGTIVLNHNNSVQTDRTFLYAIFS